MGFKLISRNAPKHATDSQSVTSSSRHESDDASLSVKSVPSMFEYAMAKKSKSNTKTKRRQSLSSSGTNLDKKLKKKISSSSLHSDDASLSVQSVPSMFEYAMSKKAKSKAEKQKYLSLTGINLDKTKRGTSGNALANKTTKKKTTGSTLEELMALEASSDSHKNASWDKSLMTASSTASKKKRDSLSSSTHSAGPLRRSKKKTERSSSLPGARLKKSSSDVSLKSEVSLSRTKQKEAKSDDGSVSATPVKRRKSLSSLGGSPRLLIRRRTFATSEEKLNDSPGQSVKSARSSSPRERRSSRSCSSESPRSRRRSASKVKSSSMHSRSSPRQGSSGNSVQKRKMPKGGSIEVGSTLVKDRITAALSEFDNSASSFGEVGREFTAPINGGSASSIDTHEYELEEKLKESQNEGSKKKRMPKGGSIEVASNPAKDRIAAALAAFDASSSSLGEVGREFTAPINGGSSSSIDMREYELEEKLKEARNENAKLQKEVQDLKEDNEYVNRRLSRYQSETERTIEAKDKELNELNETVDRILHAEQKVQISGGSMTETRLQSELDESKAKIARLEKCLADQRSEFQNLSADIQALRGGKKNGSLHRSSMKDTSEVEELKQQLKSKDETIEFLMEQLKALKLAASANSPRSGHRRTSNMDRSGHGMVNRFSDTINKWSPGTLSRKSVSTRAERMASAPTL